jgi:hypothetical protein
VRNYLRENPTLSSEIEATVRTKAAGGTAQSVQRASAAAAGRPTIASDTSSGVEEL